MSQFKVLLISNLILFAATQYSNTQCDCSQILNQRDSLYLSSTCDWESKSGLCIDKVTVAEEVQETIASSSIYCKQFNSQNDCVNKSNDACQWFNNKCSHFTGCSAFMEKTDEKCKSINNKRFTTGEHCIEGGNCSQFKSKLICKTSSTGDYCYWDDILQYCRQAIQCEEFPTTLTTDKDCRLAKSTCTVKQDGGCQQSENMCTDQMLEIQCYFNKEQTVQCFWNQEKCYEKICDNAPNSYQTDKECIDFLPQCKIKENGGCQLRVQCETVTYQPACTYDNEQKQCIWKNESCQLSTCDDATLTTKSDDQCEIFSSTCTMKADGGCFNFQECKDIIDQSRCNKTTINQKQCIWNTSCVLLTCITAPITYTATQCSQFSDEPSCIASENGGCYLPKECQEYDTEVNCKGSGTKCFWDSTCKSAQSICSNIVHFNVSLRKQINQNTKECGYLHEIQTYAQCQSYQENCTVRNLDGCREILLACEGYLFKNECIVRGHYIDKSFTTFKCYWGRNGCVNDDTKTCEDVILDNYDNQECQKFSKYCIVDNSSTTADKCIENPSQCSKKSYSQAVQLKIMNIIQIVFGRRIVVNVLKNLVLMQKQNLNKMVNHFILLKHVLKVLQLIQIVIHIQMDAQYKLKRVMINWQQEGVFHIKIVKII